MMAYCSVDDPWSTSGIRGYSSCNLLQAICSNAGVLLASFCFANLSIISHYVNNRNYLLIVLSLKLYLSSYTVLHVTGGGVVHFNSLVRHLASHKCAYLYQS